MADVERIVKIIFSGDDRVSKVAAGVSGELSSVGRAAESVAAPLAGLADGVLAADVALLSLTAGGLAYAYWASKDYESATVGLEKILSEKLKPQMKEVKAEVLDLSGKYGVAATSMMNSTTEFKRAGFGLQESLGLAETATRLVIGAAEAEYEVANASSDIIAILKGFQAEASAANRVTDILNKTSNEYATSVGELSQGMSRLAPIAQQAGFSFAETAGLLTPVIEVFRSGEIASEGFKTTLLRLTSETSDVKDALGRIGVAQYDVNGAMRSGKDIFYDVQRAYQDLDEAQKPLVTQMLAGKNHAAKMAIAFDRLAYTSEVTATAMGAAGSIAAEVEAKFATSQVAVDRFTTGWKNLAIVTGDKFRTSATGAVIGLTEIETVLQRLVVGGSFDALLEAFDQASQEAGDFFSGIAQAMPDAVDSLDWDRLLGSLDAVSDAISDLFGNLDLTDSNDLGQFLQTAVDMVTGLTNVTRGMIEQFQPFFNQFRDWLLLLSKNDKEAEEAVGKILAISKAISGLGVELAAAALLLDTFGADAKRIFDVVGGAAQVMFNGFQVLLSTAGLSLLRISDDIYSVLEIFAFGELKERIQMARRDIQAGMDDIRDAIVRDGLDAERGLKRLGNGLFGVEAAAEAAADGMEKTGQAARDLSGSDVTVKVEARNAETVRDELAALGYAVEKIPEELLTRLSVDTDPEAFASAWEALNRIPDVHTTTYGAIADQESVEATKRVLDGVPGTVDVAARVDPVSAAKTKADLDKAAPPEKPVEAVLSVDKKRMEAQAKVVESVLQVIQTQTEWEAKLEIAEVEANAEKVAAIMDGLSNTISSTGDTLGELFSLWFDASRLSDQMQIAGWVREEMAIRQEAHEKQMQMADAEMRLMQARTDRYRFGDPLITVTGDGLAPHLQQIMWSLFENIQIAASEEYHEFLFGGKGLG